MRLVARRLFGVLYHDTGRHYIVCIEDSFAYNIYADNDEEAIKIWDSKIKK